MALLTKSEMKKIESKFPEGVTSEQVVKIFHNKGNKFSEATLRKYVQLGLLPTSRRVGIRGRHRGSSGMYPTGVIRLINEIKDVLGQGLSLSEVCRGKWGLLSETLQLQTQMSHLFERVQTSIQIEQKTSSQRAALRRLVLQQQKKLSREVKQLEQLLEKIGASSKS